MDSQLSPCHVTLDSSVTPTSKVTSPELLFFLLYNISLVIPSPYYRGPSLVAWKSGELDFCPGPFSNPHKVLEMDCAG